MRTRSITPVGRNDGLLLLGIAMMIATMAPAPLSAQTARDTAVIYEREVFDYARGARPDPFRSLLTGSELGIRIEDLTVEGIVYHSDPARALVVLAQRGTERRIRARAGDNIGGVRIVAIRPQSVDVVVEEFGIARRETLELRTVPTRESQ
jgi:type II secretory pathway component PulC